MNGTFQKILQQTKAVKAPNGQWVGHCPAHEDKSPSLSLKCDDDRILLKCFSGCGTEEIAHALQLSQKDLFLDGYKSEPLLIQDLAEKKGFPIDFLKSLGVFQHPNGVKITYYTLDGRPARRQRLRNAISGTKGSIWLSGPGSPVPYGLNRLAKAKMRKSIILVEGETDCWSLWYHGFAALGIPGASMTSKLEAEHLIGIDTIYVHHEPDDGGNTFVKGIDERLKKIGWKGNVLEFNVAPHKDLNDLHLADCEKFSKVLQTSLDNSKPIDYSQLTGKSKSFITCLADIKTEEIKWVWKNRIPKGKLTLLVGDPGLGKSFLTCYAASVLSKGGEWPDKTIAPKGKTLMLSIEDDPRDTIVPRLRGMDADVSQIFTQQISHFDLSLLLPEIEQGVKELNDLQLIVIDPITALLGGRDGNSNSDIRGLLAPISDMAQRLQIAVLVVSHLNKSSQGKAIYRTSGSLAFTAAARAVWLLAQHPNEKSKRIMYPIKNNLAANTGGLSFALEGEPTNLVWDDGVYEFAENELLASFKPNTNATPQALTEAEDFILETLELGPLAVDTIYKTGKQKGINERTLRRAKKSLGVKSNRIGFGENGHYVWEL